MPDDKSELTMGERPNIPFNKDALVLMPEDAEPELEMPADSKSEIESDVTMQEDNVDAEDL